MSDSEYNADEAQEKYTDKLRSASKPIPKRRRKKKKAAEKDPEAKVLLEILYYIYRAPREIVAIGNPEFKPLVCIFVYICTHYLYLCTNTYVTI